ncbi:MAG: hypothetical protein ATN32_07370 [Candidatus Epulonipiscium fishelsonii]|nr:MAG: hypothetical protein ATN32_07370 [Epulopiscium sp. AS2M-Bin002]
MIKKIYNKLLIYLKSILEIYFKRKIYIVKKEKINIPNNFINSQKKLYGRVFIEDFNKLIEGLDQRSVETVLLIINRLQKLNFTKKTFITLFNLDEENEINKVQNIRKYSIKLSENLYRLQKYLLPINYFEASVFYYKHQLDEVVTIDKVKHKAVLDVGGYIGDSILVLNELKPIKIYSFEAIPKHFDLLLETIKLNNIKNVVAVNVALGNRQGYCNIHMTNGASSSINLKQKNDKINN